MLFRSENTNGVGASGIDFFPTVPGIHTAADRRDYALLASVLSGLELLRKVLPHRSIDQYHWGELQRVALNHPIPGLSIGPIPTDGGFQTVDPASFNVRATKPEHFIYDFGAGHRSVYELSADGNRAAAIWAGGTSGDPRNANYARFLGRWVGNQYVPLLLGAEAVQSSGATVQHYAPN